MNYRLDYKQPYKEDSEVKFESKSLLFVAASHSAATDIVLEFMSEGVLVVDNDGEEERWPRERVRFCVVNGDAEEDKIGVLDPAEIEKLERMFAIE